MTEEKTAEEMAEEIPAEETEKPEEAAEGEEPEKEQKHGKHSGKKDALKEKDAEIEALKQKIEELEGNISELKNAYARAYADTENIKKRLNAEFEQRDKYKIRDFAAEILPVLDNCERALAIEVKDDTDANYRKGFEMVYRQLLNALNRNASHHSHHFGHIVFGDGHAVVAFLLLKGAAHIVELRRQFALLVAQCRRLVVALLCQDGLLLLHHLGNLLLHIENLLRHTHIGDAHTRAGLVHSVDSLVGQQAVADVALGQADAGLQRVVGVAHQVVVLVFVRHCTLI